MDPFELLRSRKSHNKLIAPTPTEAELQRIFEVALRAPDHALLKPWRYRVYQGESLVKLGELFAEASLLSDPHLSEEKIQRIKTKPLRAPMLIIASVKIVQHPKVPEIEQILSGGASVQNLLMAAHFFGFSAIWRTGELASNAHLKDSLECSDNEILTGFIYLGTAEGEIRASKETNWTEYVTRF